MVNLTKSLLALVLAAGHVTGQAFQPSLPQLKQSHRVKQVDAGKKLPPAIALANLLIKHKKPVPSHVQHASAIAAQELVAAATSSTTSTPKTTSSTTSKPKTTSTATKTSTSSTTTTTTSKSTTTTTTISKSTSTAASNTSPGVAQATDIANDRQYLVSVLVGNTTFLLNFDTGSSDLWVFSTLLPASQRGSHPLYPISKSNDPGITWDISYAEGSGAAGVVNVDSVVVGGVTATVQAVEAATSVSSSFVTGIQDGNVGLGFIEGNTCSPNSCYGLIHQLAGVLPKTLFTATLRHNAPGEYDLGFIDSSKYTGSLVYTDVTDIQGAGYWEFIATGFSVGNGAPVVESIDAIADTGTSLVLVQDDILNAYYGNVPGATFNSTYGGVVFPCSSVSSLPELSFYIRGVPRTMPSAYGVYGTLPNGVCFGGIQSNNGDSVNTIGDVFLKSQFVVFDWCLQRLGFAQQAGVAV